MDNVIIDVVLGLFLVYLVLALMVTKLQETFFGTWGRSRQRTLHDMLDEALGHDAPLKAKLLVNPAIFGLYQGGPAKDGVRVSGPSAIPSDLFARALLVELYGDAHNHPDKRFSSPRLFIDKMAPAKGGSAVWGTLRTLLAGVEGNWPQFEAAIAKWFEQVGERANGWYQRKAQRRSFWVALLVAAAFNASSFSLAERFAGDPASRQAFASLAQRVVGTFGNGAGGTAGTAAATTPPATAVAAPLRADQALERAHGRIAEQYFSKQRALAGFDPNRHPLADTEVIAACAAVPPKLKGTGGNGTHWLSNPQTWLELLPPLRQAVKRARLPERFAIAPAASGASAASAQSASAARVERMEHAYLCIGNLVGWVTMAEGASSDSTVTASLRAAAADLNQAADALIEILENRRAGIVVRELFRANPAAFIECAGLPGMGRDRLGDCVASASNGTVSLPLGWTGRNVRQALCRVEAMRNDDERASDCPFGNAEVFEGHAGLGLQRLVLRGPGFSDWVLLVLGFVVTAVFVSLGAPFWFDLLGRLVKLRASGNRADTGATRAAETTAPAPDGGGNTLGAAVNEPFSDARNEFERILTSADKVGLQQLLKVTPTGLLDSVTRSALVQRARELQIELPNVDEVSLQVYTRIVGSLPAGLEGMLQAPATAATAAAPATPAMTSGTGLTAEGLRAVAPRLAVALGFKPRSGADDARALAVLYAFKAERKTRQGATPLTELPLCLRARAGELGTADGVAVAVRAALEDAARTALASDPPTLAFPRERAPWLDWALGELGHSETGSSNRAGSNPRVIAYLEAGGMPGAFGDSTDWCGAFVCWVLAQHNGELPERALPAAPNLPLRARSWTEWGQARDPQDARAGDIVILHPGGQADAHHVAFVLEIAGSRVYTVGGNQGQDQQRKRGVTVSSEALEHVVAIRRAG